MAELLVTPAELSTVLYLDRDGLTDPELLERVCDAASELLLEHLEHRDGGYLEVAPVREAALALAVDLWQQRVAPGGVVQAADFTPGPWRLGRSLITRYTGLLHPYLDTDTLVG